jgi:hypothetical protein
VGATTVNDIYMVRQGKSAALTPGTDQLIMGALTDWWVTLRTNSDVKALSGKQVSGFIAKEPAQLSNKLIQQVSYQLEQRCRDVEF